MCSSQAAVYFFSLPPSCSIELTVYDDNGKELKDYQILSFCTSGNIQVNGKKAGPAKDFSDSMSVIKSGVLTVIERVTNQLCEEGNSEALSNVLRHINVNWPPTREAEFRQIWRDLTTQNMGLFSKLDVLETKTDWVATTVAATWKSVKILESALTQKGILGPVVDEHGTPMILESCDTGHNYTDDGMISTLAYGPLDTKILRYQNNKVVASKESKRILGLAHSQSPGFAHSIPIVTKEGLLEDVRALPPLNPYHPDEVRLTTQFIDSGLSSGDETVTDSEDIKSVHEEESAPEKTIQTVVNEFEKNVSQLPVEVKEKIVKVCNENHVPPPPGLSFMSEPISELIGDDKKSEVQHPINLQQSNQMMSRIDQAVTSKMPEELKGTKKAIHVTDSGLKVVTRPNYKQERQSITMEPYHSHGNDAERAMAPFGYMRNVPQVHAPDIHMGPPLNQVCNLFEETSSEGENRFPENLYRWGLSVDHLEKRTCAARHFLSNGDGSRIECVYEYHMPWSSESYSLIVDSFRSPNGGCAMFGRALPKLQFALGFKEPVGRFLMARTKKFLDKDLPPDVYFNVPWETVCDARGPRDLHYEVESILLSSYDQVNKKLRMDFSMRKCIPEEDLITRLESPQAQEIALSTELKPGLQAPTTLTRMIRRTNADIWANMIDALCRESSLGVATEGFGFSAVKKYVEKLSGVDAKIAYSLLTWKRRAVNIIPKISAQAIGVRNGILFDPINPKPFGLMKLNACKYYDQAFLCPECGCAYKTISERRVCAVMDFVLHKATALETGYVISTEPKVYLGKIPFSVFSVTPHVGGWKEDWASYSFVSTCDGLARIPTRYGRRR
ncbi:VP5 [Kundal virus]|uniref:VP5 n=1 Tax=Kundal virus TaxID=2290890 RepID=A0A499RE41_9REOV|nr:VP5 [Kundal virus]AXG65497.1 VP5 [Kundal virus]